MDNQNASGNGLIMLAVVGGAAWLVPGGGYFVLGEHRRGMIVLVTIVLTFVFGLYIGSIGVIDPIGSKPWYVAQVMNSPAVMLIGNHVAQSRIETSRASGQARTSAEKAEITARYYHTYAKAGEVGQIYTSIAGLLNLLCIVNAMYLVHVRHNSIPGG